MRSTRGIQMAILGLLASLLLSVNAQAKIEETKLPSGFIASADYRPADTNKPAVLLLHGFLSTRNFLTVSNLVNALSEDGYTVLAPNLSLGVNQRKVSLACEAIHTHTMEADIEEIDYWVQWLINHGHHNIVLLGHSFGSLHGLLYSLKYPRAAIKKLIATSLVDVNKAIGEQVASSQIAKANAMLEKKQNGLSEYHVSYCKKYVAPAAAFLSYATWSKQKILHSIAKTKVPVEVILGSADNRMDTTWPSLLEKNGVKMTVVEGANHFFHNEHEFDLLDSVLAALQSIAQ